MQSVLFDESSITKESSCAHFRYSSLAWGQEEENQEEGQEDVAEEVAEEEEAGEEQETEGYARLHTQVPLKCKASADSTNARAIFSLRRRHAHIIHTHNAAHRPNDPI